MWHRRLAGGFGETAFLGSESKVANVFNSRAPYVATSVIGATEATTITEAMKSRPAGSEAKGVKGVKIFGVHFGRLPCPGATLLAAPGRGGRSFSSNTSKHGSESQGDFGLRNAECGLRIGD
jgi:hypothetical protein